MAANKKITQDPVLPEGMAALARMAMDQQANQVVTQQSQSPVQQEMGYQNAQAGQQGMSQRPVQSPVSSNMEEFLALVEKYKNKKSNTSNIYIDDDVYNSLDSLKALGGRRKLPKAAIISAIIEKFIRDNLETIRKAVAENSLLPF